MALINSASNTQGPECFAAHRAASNYEANAILALLFRSRILVVGIEDSLTFALEHGRLRRCDSRRVAANLRRVRGRPPARRAGLRPFRLRPRHHRRRWDLAVGARCYDGENLLDAKTQLGHQRPFFGFAHVFLF
jgi:hypothetical protein